MLVHYHSFVVVKDMLIIILVNTYLFFNLLVLWAKSMIVIIVNSLVYPFVIFAFIVMIIVMI